MRFCATSSRPGTSWVSQHWLPTNSRVLPTLPDCRTNPNATCAYLALQKQIGTSAISVVRFQGKYQSTPDWLQTQMNEAVSAALWSEGCGLTMDQALSYELEQ